MAKGGGDYSEITPFQLLFNNWREITLDIGDSQSTLQDFKLTESSGFYTYKESNAWLSPTCNRFIYWRINNDVIELCELDLDVNLIGNQIKLRFQNTPVLDGVSVHETPDEVFILISTVASVHRLILPHPRKLVNVDNQQAKLSNAFGSKQRLFTDTRDPLVRPSIFHNVSSENLRDFNTYHLLSNLYNVGTSSFSSSGMLFPVTSCSWLNAHKEAIFVLSNTIGSLLVVKMDPPHETGKVVCWELKQTTIIERLWNGLVPSIIRGAQEGEQVAVSIVSHPSFANDDYFIFALCRDLRIRMWSYMRQECLIVHDILSNLNSNSSVYGVYGKTAVGKGQHSLNVRRPILRKAIPSNSNDTLFLGAFVGAVDQKEFILINLILEDGVYKLKNHATIMAPEEDLCDFIFTNDRLWTLWINSESEVSVLHCSLKNSREWQTVFLDTQIHSQNVKSEFVDARELYVDEIFWRGKFSLQTIAKAISIISRTPESSYVGVKITTLIEEATKIVENRIRSQIGNTELTADEYTNLELTCWEKFYSYCVQYHNVANKPLGLLLDSKTGLIGFIKRSAISFLKPLETYDQIMFSNSLINRPSVCVIIEDASVEASVLSFLKYFKKFRKNLMEEMLLEFDIGMENEEIIEDIALNIVQNHLLIAIDITSVHGDPLKHSFDNIFLKTSHLIEAIEVILKAFEIEMKDSFENESLANGGGNTMQILSQFMSSNIGVCVLSECVRQVSRLKYNFCRDLLIFEFFLLQLRDKKNFSADKIEKMHAHIIPLTARYLQACFFMNWVCETPIQEESSTVIEIENVIAQLSILELNEYINVNRGKADLVLQTNDFMPKTILSLFIQHNKCLLPRKLLSSKLNSIEDINNIEIWTRVLPLMVQSIIQTLWPISSSFHIAEFLLGYGQYESLVKYVQLLDPWCQWNACSRQFMTALVYLIIGDTQKCVEMFHRAVFGIGEELFLQKIIQQPANLIQNEDQSQVLNPTYIFSYYNKLVQLFKLHSQPEAVIQISSQAVLMLDADSDADYEEHYSSLLVTLFVSHLELGNISEAYQAMILNPNQNQRKNCLRQFIVSLYERGQIQELISFSYNDLDEDFINIVESRARAADLINSSKEGVNHYEILYAYFASNNNYRRAAAVAYEYARRLSHEVPGVESVSKQAKFYAIALNCLKIVNPKYAWVIKPTLKLLPSAVVSSANAEKSFSKRDYNGHDVSQNEDDMNLEFAVRKSIEVLGIEDVQKEFELCSIRLKLLQKDPATNAIANSAISIQEALTLLIGNCMFDAAFRLCNFAKLSFEPVFEGLLSKYIYLTRIAPTNDQLVENATDIYDCFTENDTASLTYIGSANMSPVDKFWHLIEMYVKKYEKGKQSIIHRSVAEKLLSSEIRLPSSLKLSYQRRNCPQLIWLLMSYNYIEDAVNLSSDYIDAFLGNGSEYFDIEVPLLNTSKPVHFPHQHFAYLLQLLKSESKANPEYKQLEQLLNDKLSKFRTVSLQTSKSLLAYRTN